MGVVRYPSLYQVNTRILMTELAQALQRPATLDDVPDAMLDGLAEKGFDWIWLLSVWRTGTASRRVTRADHSVIEELCSTLSDLQDQDIAGSGFAITDYTVHPSLGGPSAMKRLRRRLSNRGIRLMLDFVPNHTALDHPWAKEHPEFYISGTAADLMREPQNYVGIAGSGGTVLAYGRDPNFPSWRDTLQLDYSNPATQEHMIGELVKLAAICDGVRCDMAMLVLPEVFERTWGRRAVSFWPEATKRVRAAVPGFCFLAEVYWGLEWTMLQQGFDYAYDKRLYDHLQEGVAGPVREHLTAPVDYQAKLARFLENHNEARAAAIFSPKKHQAAAAIAYLSPGMRFFHQGQLEGRRKHMPPQLVRAPLEPVNNELQRFYVRLLELLRQPLFREGEWRLLDCRRSTDGNWTWNCFIASAWQAKDGKKALVAVNYAENQSQCYVQLPQGFLGSATTVRLKDLISNVSNDADAKELASRGLHLDLPAWAFHVFEVTTEVQASSVLETSSQSARA